jgi:hypothetical protein
VAFTRVECGYDDRKGGGREGSKEMRNNDPYILPLFRLEAFALFNGTGR